MKKNWLNNFHRIKSENFDRSNFLRLDKNERIIDFNKIFLKHLKKKLDTFEIASNPNIEKINQLLAKDLKISKDSICLTAGSDFALRMCFEFFSKQKDKIITLNPTFGMVEVYTKIFGLKNIQIGYDRNLNLDIDKLFKNLKKNISMVIIANPNSPTGTIIKPDILKKIIVKTYKLKIPLVIDEAYYGFYNFSCLNYIKKYNNLVILRTFSKAYGLAGLRSGFIIANKKIAKNLFKFKPMYEINSISCIAIEFLIKNKKIINNHISHIKESKSYLIKELKNINYDYINTYGNFFHIDLKKNKKKFENILKKNKILVRKGPGVRGFDDYIRFSLGSIVQMKKIIKLIKSIKPIKH